MNEQTLLISSIGTESYQETTYRLDDEEYQSNLSPIALANILEVDAAFVARTEEAGEAYDDELATKFTNAGVKHSFASIPTVSTQADVDTVLQTIINGVRNGDTDAHEIVLDITHGFRSLPMVFFAAVMQLDALEDVSLAGIYYAEFDPEQDTSPIIDLTYLHTLMQWYHGFQTFEETGSLGSVHRLLDEKREELFRRGERPTDFASVVGSLDGARKALDSGFPLEAGLAIRDALSELEQLDETTLVGPEGAVFRPLERRLKPFGVESDVTEKAAIPLNAAEIRRQRAIVDFYRETDRYWIAVECARELFVTRALYELHEDEQQQWIDQQTRKEVSDDINEVSRTTESDPPLLRVWNRITDIRNQYAHAGFRTEGLANEAKVDHALRQLCELIDDDEAWKALESRIAE